MSTFGVGPAGFNRMRLSDCKADLADGLTQAFGATTNTSDSTVFGQLAGVFAERYALLWEALQQTYDATTVGGAEGTSVDAILALNGILRLTARPTVTEPNPSVQSNGITLNGLVLYGTPGTVVPAGTILQTSTQPTLSFTTDAAVTIGTAVSAQQQLRYSVAPTAGSYQLTLLAPSGSVLTTPSIAYNAQPLSTTVTFAATPTSAFTLTLGGALNQVTASLPATATAAQVQTALQNLPPYQTATVTQSGLSYIITWPNVPNPTVSVQFASTTVGVTVTQSVQALINTLQDSATSLYPFTDVRFVQPAATQAGVLFGANTPVTGQPSSGNAQQATLGVTANTLTAGTTAVNVAVTTSVTGRAAQAIASATCTVNGPNAVPAGALNVIGSGVTGLTSVINQLDCETGRNVETDTEAMARRETLLAARGSGALPSLVSSVLALSDVTTAIGFSNLTNAAQQVVMFSQTPTRGTYQLAYQGTPTTTLSYSATAGQVQAALGALPGLSNILTYGSNVFGFVVDFNGSFGGQAVPLLSVLNNTTDATLTPYFGRPPKSVELVVQGGTNAEVAAVIFNSLPAGVASYAQPILRTLGSTVAGSTAVSLVSVVGLASGQTLAGQGLYPGTLVQSVTGNTATVTPAALGSYSNVAMVASNAASVLDAAGNTHLVSFSRPTVVPIYISVQLITDTYLVPGSPSSGLNPAAQFNPASVAQIQGDLLAAANATPIGGSVIARGTNGLAGSFRDVVGLLDYTLAFDVVSPPVNQNNLALPAEGVASAESFNCNVSYT